MSFLHRPVLVDEVIRILNPTTEGIYMDCTVGCGGHAEKILESSKPAGFLVGIDVDEESLVHAKDKLAQFKGRFKLVNDRYERMRAILKKLQIQKVDGILMDLGISSWQVDNPDRGFSFKKDGKLDMRFSKSQGLSAYDIVNDYSCDQLEEIIRKYGEERWAKRIANNIVKKRSQARIESTLELSNIIKDSIPRRFWSNRIDVSTKTFQAIRIAVNQEIESLGEAIRTACDLLNSRSRMIIISYHSLEDRIVKEVFKELSTDCLCPPHIPTCVCSHKRMGKILTFKNHTENRNGKGKQKAKKKFLTPTIGEIKENPRSRSAKLRAFERIENEE